MSEKGRSSDSDREAEIRSEIEKRVFQESRARAEKKQRAREEQIEVEALAEVSELSPEEVEQISREVRDEHRSSTDSEAQADAAPRGGRRFFARAVPIVLVVVAVAAVFAIVASYVAKDRRSRAEAEAARKYFALLDALEKGNAQMVQYLLDQGAPLRTPAGRGYGPADSALKRSMNRCCGASTAGYFLATRRIGLILRPKTGRT